MIHRFISTVHVQIALGLTFLSFGSVLSQGLLWPTDAGRILSATFAEFRPGHLHAGIDIKTWGRSGYRCFAVDSGSVSRIRTSPYGYGKAVYFRLQDGRTCVYAHLLKFSHVLDSLIREEQDKTGRYETDLWPQPGSLKFEKGDILGYTGSSGTKDPHLHFEVRDAANRPFDPLTLGFPVKDTAPPVLESLLVSPLAYGSSVNGDFVPCAYGLLQSGPGTYRLRDTVQVWGTLGFAVAGYDPMDGASNRNGAKAMRFYVGDSLLFAAEYAWFDYGISGQSVLEWDYRILRTAGRHFRDLYIHPENDLPFYSRPGVRNGTVQACDPGDDGSGDPSPGASASALRRTARRIPMPSSLQTGDSPQQVAGSFNPFASGSYGIGRGNWTFLAEVSDYSGNCSRISGVMRAWPASEPDGKAVRPVVKQNGVFGTAAGGLKTRFFDDYLYFRWTPDTGTVFRAFLKLTVPDGRSAVMPMMRHSGGWWFYALPLSGMLPDHLFAAVETRFKNGTAGSEDRTIGLHAAYPGRPMLIRSEDNRFRIFFDRDVLYQPVWGQVLMDTVRVSGMGQIAGYRLDYNDVPLRRPAEVFMDTGGDAGDTDRIGIYTCEAGGAPEFRGDKKLGNWISADAKALGFFALIRDTVPPSLSGIRPVFGAESATRKPMISAFFRDDLSGIQAEDQYQFWLDGSRLVVEYDPGKGRGFHRPQRPLNTGRHELEFIIRDRAGNETRRKSVFFIKPR
ncbi:M23 family metallopeptidase [bacterium]|nr:M23 family metallopeptidase [bacterium]